MEKRKNGTMIYRTKDFIWNNFPQEAFEPYMKKQEHIKYYLVKDQVTNQPTKNVNAQNKTIVKNLRDEEELYNPIEYGTVPLAAKKDMHILDLSKIAVQLRNKMDSAKKEG